MLNKVFLVGNVGKEPKGFGDGRVVKFSVATTERWMKDGEPQEKTEWHNIAVFGKLADICSNYVHKGSLVYIEGKLQTNKYQEKYYTNIIAMTVRVLNRGSQGGAVPEDETEKYTRENDPTTPVTGDDDVAF